MIQGFFKAELDLPHKAIPLAIHLKVEEALRASWDKLRKNPPAGFLVGTAPEDVVTHELLKILHGEVFDSGEVDGFTRDYFETPVREAKVENFDGTKRDLMPDLRIGLIGRPKARIPWQDYLFIECKPVDADHTVGAHYCDKGLIRFVRGDYAWAMQSAMMVGYARAGYTILPKLIEALELEPRSNKIPTIDQPHPCRRSKDDSVSEAVHISKQGRTFKYLETEQSAPAITIRHLWLKRPV
jgi:hypothetical protein